MANAPVLNPLIEFMEITDSWGTNISRYAIVVDGLVERAIGSALLIPEVIILTTIAAIGAWLISLFTDTSVWITPLAKIIDSLLTSLFSVIPIQAVLALGLSVLVVRVVVTVKRTDSISQQGLLNVAPGLSAADGNKALIDALKHALISSAIVLLLVSNPAAIMARIIDATATLTNEIVAGGQLSETGSLGSTFITRILSSLIINANFGTTVDDTCKGQWSAAMASGDYDQIPGCLGEPVNVGVIMIMLLFSLIVIIAYAYYAAMVFARATWFMFNLLLGVIIIPYKVTVGLFSSVDQMAMKRTFDEIYDRAWNMGVYLVFYLAMIFAALALPTVLFTVLTEAFPSIIALILLAAILVAAGYYIKLVSPKKILRGEGAAGADSWREFTGTFRNAEGKWSLDNLRDDDSGRLSWSKFTSNTAVGREFIDRRDATLKAMFGEDAPDKIAEINDSAKSALEKGKQRMHNARDYLVNGVSRQDFELAHATGMDWRDARAERLTIEKLNRIDAEIDALTARAADGDHEAGARIAKLRKDRQDAAEAAQKSQHVLDSAAADKAGYVSLDDLREAMEEAGYGQLSEQMDNDEIISRLGSDLVRAFGDGSGGTVHRIHPDALRAAAIDALRADRQRDAEHTREVVVTVAEAAAGQRRAIDDGGNPDGAVGALDELRVMLDGIDNADEIISGVEALSKAADRADAVRASLSKRVADVAEAGSNPTAVRAMADSISESVTGLVGSYGQSTAHAVAGHIETLSAVLDEQMRRSAAGVSIDTDAIDRAVRTTITAAGDTASDLAANAAAGALAAHRRDIRSGCAHTLDRLSGSHESFLNAAAAAGEANTSVDKARAGAASGAPMIDTVAEPVSDEVRQVLTGGEDGTPANAVYTDASAASFDDGSPAVTHSQAALSDQINPPVTPTSVVTPVDSDDVDVNRVLDHIGGDDEEDDPDPGQSR